jgi:hypothetical protein
VREQQVQIWHHICHSTDKGTAVCLLVRCISAVLDVTVYVMVVFFDQRTHDLLVKCSTPSQHRARLLGTPHQQLSPCSLSNVCFLASFAVLYCIFCSTAVYASCLLLLAQESRMHFEMQQISVAHQIRKARCMHLLDCVCWEPPGTTG